MTKRPSVTAFLAAAFFLVPLAALPVAADEGVFWKKVKWDDAPKPAVVTLMAQRIPGFDVHAEIDLVQVGLPGSGATTLVFYAVAGFDAYCDSRLVVHDCWGYTHGYHGSPGTGLNSFGYGESEAANYGVSHGHCTIMAGQKGCESPGDGEAFFFADRGDCVYQTAATKTLLGTAKDDPDCVRI